MGVKRKIKAQVPWIIISRNPCASTVRVRVVGRQAFSFRQIWDWILLPSGVSANKEAHLSESQFGHLWNGENAEVHAEGLAPESKLPRLSKLKHSREHSLELDICSRELCSEFWGAGRSLSWAESSWKNSSWWVWRTWKFISTNNCVLCLLLSVNICYRKETTERS